MSDVQREMTLEEWVGKLPDIHLAHREYTDLRARLGKAVAENEAWRSGAIYLIHVKTDDGFVDKFAHKDRGYWEPYETIEAAVDALLAEEE